MKNRSRVRQNAGFGGLPGYGEMRRRASSDWIKRQRCAGIVSALEGMIQMPIRTTFVVLCLCASTSSAQDAAKDVKVVLDDQVAAWNAGDLERFMKGYWDDDRLSFFSGNDKTAGWKATLERYRKRY